MATRLTEADLAMPQDARLIAKIGSVIVHAEELLGPGGHDFDIEAIRGLLKDPDLIAWMESVRRFGLLPAKRSD